MVDAAMENATLVRRTLVLAGAMVGACAAVVGTLTLAAVLVVGHAVGPASSAATDGTAGSGVPGAPGAIRAAPPAGIATSIAPGAQKK